MSSKNSAPENSASASAQDPIDAAIAKTGAPERIAFPLTFGNERSGQLVLPVDIGPGEILGLIAFIATTIAPTLRSAQQAAAQEPSGIEVPKRPRLFVPN
jgi:hypothetical protein